MAISILRVCYTIQLLNLFKSSLSNKRDVSFLWWTLSNYDSSPKKGSLSIMACWYKPFPQGLT